MRKLLFLAASLLAATSLLAADAEHKFQSSVPRGAVKRVLIDVPYGSFTIRNGSDAQIGVSGIASRDYDGRKEGAWAQKVVDDTSVEVYVNGSEAVVRRKFGSNAQSWRAQRFTGIDLRLDLPAGVDIEFDTTAGELDIAGTFGDIDADLRAGEIKVTVPRTAVKELTASCRIGEVRANLGKEIVSKEGIFPSRTKFFNPSGASHVNVHVTTGEIDVVLTQ